MSGLTLNHDKTEAIWLGTLRHRQDKLFDFQWPIKDLLEFILGTTQQTPTNLTGQIKLRK